MPSSIIDFYLKSGYFRHARATPRGVDPGAPGRKRESVDAPSGDDSASHMRWESKSVDNRVAL